MHKKNILIVAIGVVLLLLISKNNSLSHTSVNSTPKQIESKDANLSDYYTSREIKTAQHNLKNKRIEKFTELITDKKYYEAYQYASENAYISDDFEIYKNYSYALFLLREKQTGYSITAYLNKIPPQYNGPFSKDIKRLVQKYMTVKEWQENYQAGQNL